MTPQKLRETLFQLLDDKKAQDINIVDLKGKTYLADYYIIASVTSQRHLFALSEFLKQEVKALGLSCYVEGEMPCDWVIVDAGDVIVHLFLAPARAYYNLDKMWAFHEEEVQKGRAKKIKKSESDITTDNT